MDRGIRSCWSPLRGGRGGRGRTVMKTISAPLRAACRAIRDSSAAIWERGRCRWLAGPSDNSETTRDMEDH